MSIPIPLSDLAALLGRIPDQPIGTAGLGRDLAKGAVERDLPVKAGAVPGLELSLKAASEVSLSLFNSPDDRDDDGVLRPSAADGLPPPIPFAPGQGWIRTRFEATAGAGGELSAGAAGGGIQAGARLLLADYRVHPATVSVRSAVMGGLSGVRFAARVDDVLSLAPGEALSQQLAGTLSATVTVEWADVLAGQLSLLREAAGTGGVIPIRVAPSARVAAKVELKDELLLVISCVGADRYRVSLKRAGTRALGAGATLEVKAEIQEPEAVGAMLDGVIEGVLGAAEARVREAVTKAIEGRATPEQIALVQRVLQRLGLADAAALRQRLDGLRAKLGDAVRQAARTKIEAGFAYEYQRVREDSSVLQVVMSGAALRAHHRSLVRARFDPALDAVRRGDPGVQLEWFLGERTLDMKRSWGFTLGIGKWQGGGEDTKRIRSVEQRDLADRKRVSWVGVRGYQGRWGESEFEWAGDFAASMRSFSAGPRPRITDYTFGISLTWSNTVARLTEEGVRELLDTALVWEAFPQEELPEVAARLKGALGQRVEMVTQLRLDDFEVRTALGSPQLDDARSVAPALGAAMPWLRGEPARDDVMTRRFLYTPLWAAYVNQPRERPDAFAETAERHLRGKGQSALAGRERHFAASRAHTFAGLIELNPSTHEALEGFRAGLRTLRDAVQAHAPEGDTIEKTFRGISGLWAQSLHVRAAGAYLLDLLRPTGIHEEVKRTVTVSAPDQVVVVGK